MSIGKRAAVMVAVVSAVAVGLFGGEPEVRRELRKETAERKAADAALARATETAIDTVRAVLKKAIADGDAKTAAAATAADAALRKYLDTSLAKESAATRAAAQAANDALEALLRSAIDAGDRAALTESKLHADLAAEKAKKEAKEHTDKEVDKAKTEAKAHADVKATEAELHAKLHADQMTEQAKTEVETDANIKAQTAKQEAMADADSKIAQTKTDVDVKLLNTKNESTSESKAYVDLKLTDTVNEVRADAIVLADATLTAAKAYTDSKVAGTKPPKVAQRAALLMLDGEFGTWLETLEMTQGTEVIQESANASGTRPKHVSGDLTTTEIRVTLNPFGGSARFNDWINATLAGLPSGANGRLYVFGPGGKVSSRVDLVNVLPFEIAFPAFDNTVPGAQPCTATLTLLADHVALGAAEPPPAVPPARVSKGCRVDWDVPGLEDGLHRLGALQITSKRLHEGIGRDPLVLAGVTIPDLVFTIPAARADNWRDWFDEFVVQGHSAADDEKQGKLTFFDDKGVVVGALRLTHLGVFSLGFSAGSDGMLGDDLEIKAYSEGMEVANP